MELMSWGRLTANEETNRQMQRESSQTVVSSITSHTAKLTWCEPGDPFTSRTLWLQQYSRGVTGGMEREPLNRSGAWDASLRVYLGLQSFSFSV